MQTHSAFMNTFNNKPHADYNSHPGQPASRIDNDIADHRRPAGHKYLVNFIRHGIEKYDRKRYKKPRN